MRRRQKVTFKSPSGYDLVGLLELPMDLDPYAIAIFAHCFTCNKNFSAMRYISKALQANDIAVLRFDFTGLGESAGEFADTTFGSNLQDLIAAGDFMDEHFPNKPKILVGHSLGGAAVIHVANQMSNVKAVVSVGAPFEPYHVTHLFDNKREALEKDGKIEVVIGGRLIQIGKKFMDEIRSHSASDVVKNLKKPLLILHSPQDRIVEIYNAAKIYEHAHHPKSFISLNGADHLLSSSADALYSGEVIASWIQKYVPQPAEEEIHTTSKVAARLDDDDGFSTQIKAGIHRMMMDEPKSTGGKNIGPDPYAYLSAALAGCTAMTLQMYAKRKGWPLEEVIVHVDHTYKHYEDCDRCEELTPTLNIFTKRIEIKGDLTSEQIDKLLVMADKCPVHRTLISPISVQSEWAGDD